MHPVTGVGLGCFVAAILTLLIARYEELYYDGSVVPATIGIILAIGFTMLLIGLIAGG